VYSDANSFQLRSWHITTYWDIHASRLCNCWKALVKMIIVILEQPWKEIYKLTELVPSTDFQNLSIRSDFSAEWRILTAMWRRTRTKVIIWSPQMRCRSNPQISKGNLREISFMSVPSRHLLIKLPKTTALRCAFVLVTMMLGFESDHQTSICNHLFSFPDPLHP
jgi:hypothetical protein